jgi:hypothetical protein
MNNKSAEIAARITALEQHLLVAVLRGDDHARSLVRGEIASLKRRLPPAASHERGGRSPRSAMVVAPALAR